MSTEGTLRSEMKLRKQWGPLSGKPEVGRIAGEPLSYSSYSRSSPLREGVKQSCSRKSGSTGDAGKGHFFT